MNSVLSPGIKDRVLLELTEEKATLSASQLAERCGCSCDDMLLVLGEMLHAAPRRITCTTVFDEDHAVTELRFRKTRGAGDRSV